MKSELGEKYDEWTEGHIGKLCVSTDILHFDSYESVMRARIKAAFKAGAEANEEANKEICEKLTSQINSGE